MLVSEQWERVAIDITSKHPKSRIGNEYMVTVMDDFSKWAKAYPLKDPGGATVQSSTHAMSATQQSGP